MAGHYGRPRRGLPIGRWAADRQRQWALFVFSLVTSSLYASIPHCTEVARRRRIVLYNQQQDEVYSLAGIPTLVAAPARAPPSRRRFFRRK